MIRKIRRFFYPIYNLIRWAPVIWKDRDWDRDFIYEIIKFKLKNQAKYIGGKNRHTTAKRDARNMLICVNLIDKIQSDYYELEHFDYHESHFVLTPISGKTSVSVDIVLDHENFDEYFKKYPLWYKRSVKYLTDNKHRYCIDVDDKKLIASTIGKLRNEKAKNLVFKIMNDEIESWWD